eukprot:UN20862
MFHNVTKRQSVPKSIITDMNASSKQVKCSKTKDLKPKAKD